MAFQNTKAALAAVTDFQKQLHAISPYDDDNHSHYEYDCRKMSWGVHFRQKLDTNDKTTEVVYTVNDSLHYLNKTWMIQTFRELKVKPEHKKDVQICLPHSIGSNIVINGYLVIDKEQYNLIDGLCFDRESQYFMKSGFTEHYKMCVGNVPMLEEWGSHLPKYTTVVPQPYFYAKHYMNALRIFNISPKVITHKYKLRSKLSEIVRMRKLFPSSKVKKEEDKDIDEKDDNNDTPHGYEWRDIPFNPSYLVDVQPDEKLPTPELWGDYSLLSDEELKYRMAQVKNNKKITQYIEDTIPDDSKKAVRYGDTAEFNIFSHFPIKTIYFVAENQRATSNKNFSNYSTNRDNLYKGFNPCYQFNLNHNGPLLEDMTSEHFDRIDPWKFPSAPTEPGNNILSFGVDPGSIDVDVGRCFPTIPAKLSILIRNTDPYFPEEDREQLEKESTEKFIVKLRMTILRELIYSSNGVSLTPAKSTQDEKEKNNVKL